LKLEKIYENKAYDCLKKIKESQNRAVENFRKLERLNNGEINNLSNGMNCFLNFERFTEFMSPLSSN